VVIRLLSLSGRGVELVTSAEVDSPPVLDSEVSGIIVCLRERFEAVRRSKIHRVRGRLGNLSSDQEHVVGMPNASMIWRDVRPRYWRSG
jgi:hypothetical protein